MCRLHRSQAPIDSHFPSFILNLFPSNTPQITCLICERQPAEAAAMTAGNILIKERCTLGIVAISSFTCGIFSSCTSLAVIFDSQQYGSLSSSVFSGNSYQVFLPSGTIFSVRLYYLSTFFGSTLRTCSGLPSIFATPSGTNSLSQDFTC